LQRTFKVICCYCGHIHIHHNIDEPLEKCEMCKTDLSADSTWDSHKVRIYVEDADPNLIEDFIEGIKAKRIRLVEKKKTGRKKATSRVVKKVA